MKDLLGVFAITIPLFIAYFLITCGVIILIASTDRNLELHYRAKFQQEAIEHHAAQWLPTEGGDAIFAWKESK